MTDAELIRRCDVLEILDNEGSLGRTRKLVEQLVAVTPEAQAAEIERLRGELARAVNALERVSNSQPRPKRNGDYDRSDVSALQRIARATLAELTGSATVKDSLTTEDEKQSHEWKCPIDYPGCRKYCGSPYGCKN